MKPTRKGTVIQFRLAAGHSLGKFRCKMRARRNRFVRLLPVGREVSTPSWDPPSLVSPAATPPKGIPAGTFLIPSPQQNRKSGACGQPSL